MISTNNPGNLRPSKPPWNGTTGAYKGFATFDTMENGIRAMAKQLIAYQDRHGINTVRATINRWAPPEENDTDAYVEFVAHLLEVGPDDKLDFRSDGALFWLVTAIGEYENGASAFTHGVTDEEIMAGVESALA